MMTFRQEKNINANRTESDMLAPLNELGPSQGCVGLHKRLDLKLPQNEE
jgi:hypothetical protein